MANQRTQFDIYDVRLEYDSFYVRQLSVWLDWYLYLKTFRVVVLCEVPTDLGPRAIENSNSFSPGRTGLAWQSSKPAVDDRAAFCIHKPYELRCEPRSFTRMR